MCMCEEGGRGGGTLPLTLQFYQSLNLLAELTARAGLMHQ